MEQQNNKPEFKYFLYELKPPVIEGNIGQANFIKAITSGSPIIEGNILSFAGPANSTGKDYMVERVVHTPYATCVLLLEAKLGFQFNPAPFLIDIKKENS